METLIRIGKIVGTCATIAGCLGSLLVGIRKFVYVIDKLDKLLVAEQKREDTLSDLKASVAEMQEIIKDLKDDFSALETKNTQDEAEQKKSNDLLLSIARRQLLESFNIILDKGEMTAETFTVLSKLYNSYTANSGNSVICDMWEKVKLVQIRQSLE